LRVRRIGWRASVTLVLAFSVAQASGATVDWVLALAPVPALLEPLLWPLWPRNLRRAVRSAQVYEELVAANFRYAQDQARSRLGRRFGLRRRPQLGGWAGALAVGFDPDRGVCGRPQPLASSEPGAKRGAPPRATPAEKRRDEFRTYLETQILLLDAEGRRLLALPGLGMRQGGVGAVAHAAGLRFAAYELLLSGREGPRPLSGRLFPKRRGHIRLRFG
jgi:hypothetical protein